MKTMKEHIINIKALESNEVHLVPASSEEHQVIMKLLRDKFDSFIKINKEKETEYEEQYEKLCRF